jgi:competence protein ComEA
LSTSCRHAGRGPAPLPSVRSVRLTSRRSDDHADLIRARLRALLDEGTSAGGWLPDDDLDLPTGEHPDTDLPDDPTPGVRAWRLPAEEGPDPAAEAGGEELPKGLARHRAPGTAVRLEPGRRGAWSLWLAGLVGALVLVVWTWLDRPHVHPLPETTKVSAPVSSSSPAPRTPSVGEAARTSTTVVVSVVGRVTRPGLVTLRSGARVADAIDAAGGLLPGTDPAAVNLAAVVTDGQQIAVGAPGAAATAAGPSTSAAGGPLDLNTASAGDLDTLPGIGPVLAQRIVDFRQQHGSFTTVDQLSDVPGIGPALYGRLAARVRV